VLQCRRPTPRPQPVISLEEINGSSARDAYHAVQLLRPDWLRRSRGASSMRDTRPQPVIVYVDGQRYGDVRSLEQFRIGSFKELRYFTGSEATNRWGTGHGGGVIFLSSR
jgi:hypothetical protein